MKRRTLVCLAAVLVTLGIAAAAQSNSAADSINIGNVSDSSGPTVNAQRPVLHGMEAYFKMVNDAGGIKGRKINLINKDDQYNLAKNLALTKSLIDDDKVPLIAGLGMTSGYSAIAPVLASTNTIGFISQATLKDMSQPLQKNVFNGNCNGADQIDVGLGYMMARFKKKNLQGMTVGAIGLTTASGLEWIDIVKQRVAQLGGTTVEAPVPVVITSGDITIADLQQKKVDFIMMFHQAGITLMRSMAKFDLLVPIAAQSSLANEQVFTASPYEVSKNMVGMNCMTPPDLAKTPTGKLAVTMGKKYGYPDLEVKDMLFALGWVNGQTIVQALRNANGVYTADAIRKGLEKVSNLDTGGLSPNVRLSANCHMGIRQVRPYTYNYQRKSIMPVGSYAQWAKFITNGYAAPGTCGRKK